MGRPHDTLAVDRIGAREAQVVGGDPQRRIERASQPRLPEPVADPLDIPVVAPVVIRAGWVRTTACVMLLHVRSVRG